MSAKRCFQVDPTTSTLAKRHNGEINLRQFHRNEASQRFEDETRLKIANDIIGSPEDEESDLLAIIKMGSTTKAVGEVASSLQSQLHNLTTTVNNTKSATHQLDREGPVALGMKGTEVELLSHLATLNDAMQKLYGRTEDKEKKLLRLSVVDLKQKLEGLENERQDAVEFLSGAYKEGLSPREPTHDFGATILEIHSVVQTLTAQRDELQTQLQSSEDELEASKTAAQTQIDKLKESNRGLEAEVQNMRMQAEAQTAKRLKADDKDRLVVRLRTERNEARAERVEDREEHQRKTKVAEKRLQKTKDTHKKALEKSMHDMTELRSENQKLQRQVRDAKRSQAVAEAQVREASDNIAGVKHEINAKAIHRIKLERQKMDTVIREWQSKRQGKIKAQKQAIAREAELKNNMEKTVMDSHTMSHEYELKLCKKDFELTEIKLRHEIQAAETSKSRTEDELNTTKANLQLEVQRTTELADEAQKLRVASLEASLTHQKKVEELKDKSTRINTSLQQTKHELDNTKRELDNTKRELDNTKRERDTTKRELDTTKRELDTTKETLRLEMDRINAAAEDARKLSTTYHNEVERLKEELALTSESLDQTNERSGQYKEVTQSETRHLRSKGFLLRWRLVTAEARLAKKTNDLRQENQSAQDTLHSEREHSHSERQHSRKKVSFLRWHLVVVRAQLAKKKALMGELLATMGGASATSNIPQDGDTELGIPYGSDIALLYGEDTVDDVPNEYGSRDGEVL